MIHIAQQPAFTLSVTKFNCQIFSSTPPAIESFERTPMIIHKTVSDDRNFQATLLQADLDRIVAQIPGELAEEVKDKGLVIAGGFIRSILRGEPVNDIDLFKITNITEAVKDEAIRLSKELGVGVFFTTDNAVSFEVYGHTAAKPVADHVKVQYIIKYTSPTVMELLQKFDFTNSMAAIWYENGIWKSMCHNGFYGDIGTSSLKFNPDFKGDRVILMKRFVKFVTNDWEYTAGDFARIIAEISKEAVEWQDIYKLLCSNAYGRY